jgi:1,4-dihydroxy-2-naphthoate octaprenyltransferase
VPIVLGLGCALVAPWSVLVVLLAFPAGLLTVTVLAGARGRLLIPVLAGTGLLELAFGVLLGLGLAL